nr:hypothetical protein [Tanacetum cinerariifolium]
PQQYPCCEDYGVLLEADHCQPLQYTVNHPIFNAHNDLFGSGTTLMEQMEQLRSMCEMFCQFIQKKQEEKRIEEEQAAKAQNSKILAFSSVVTGPGIVEVEVPSAFAVVLGNGLKELPFSMTSHRE